MSYTFTIKGVKYPITFTSGTGAPKVGAKPDIRRVTPTLPDGWTDWDRPTYAVNWEGQEALRRVDAETTRPMRAVAKPRKRWWRR